MGKMIEYLRGEREIEIKDRENDKRIVRLFFSKFGWKKIEVKKDD